MASKAVYLSYVTAKARDLELGCKRAEAAKGNFLSPSRRGACVLEAARARGIEVLLLSDPIDAFWTAAPMDFAGKPLKSLSQGDLDFGLVPLLEEGVTEKRRAETVDEAAIISAVKGALGDRISDVRASQRLSDSPSCLIAAKHGPDLQIERLLTRENRGAGIKPILELNMGHALVMAISTAKDDLNDLSLLLFEQAQILDGALPDDPAAFASRLN